MLVKQIYTIMNNVTKEVTGQTDLVKEDLSNIVDVGVSVFGATSVDNYVKALVDHIGRVIFVNRPYSGGAPSVLMDGWEYGAVCEKIQSEIPEAVENESWDLTDGQSYDPNVFYKPVVSAKFFSKKVTFEIDRSFTELQVRGSFSSATQLNAFLSMLYNDIDKAMTINIDGLIMRTINNMTAQTMWDSLNSNGTLTITGKTSTRAVNLLYQYNQAFGASLTVDKCLTTPEFIRYAINQILIYKKRMRKASKLFNGGGKIRFTPDDMSRMVILSDLKTAADVYLQSDTYHDEYTMLPQADDVPYWQGSGTDYSLDSISAINVNTAQGNTVSVSGVLGVLFDRDALGVANLDRRVTTNYNAKAEFYTNFYKFDAGYFNDFDENFVVFYVA